MTMLFTPNFQRGDANGNPYSGAKLYFYQSGTTTPITTYQDSAKATPHANPVVADASGAFAEIYVDTDPFKFVLKTSADVTIETVDAVPLLAGASIVGADLTAIEALSTTGMMARTAANTYALRTIAGTAPISVSNGDGVSGNPTISAATASASDYRSNTADKLLVTDDVWSAATPVDLGSTLTGNLTLDLGAFLNAYGTATGNVTFNAVSNYKSQSGIIRITASGGNRTVSFNTSAFATPNNTSLSTITSGATMMYSYGPGPSSKVVLIELGTVS